MAGITESNNWSPEVYRFETEDVVLGGEDGLDNLPGKQLAGRTNWLRLMITAVCTAESVPVLNNETTQFLTALDSRIGNAIAALVDSSPTALNTLNELAAALGDDPNFATTVTNALALKAPLASPAFSGTPTAPTAAPGTSDTQVANTEFVQEAIAEISSGASIQGARRNLKSSTTGTSAVVTYTIDELVTSDGAGHYLTTHNWNDTINMANAGPGGLDTGSVAASTFYYAYGITKDDGTKALIASLSSTGPLLSGGYTKWARVGTIITDPTVNKFPLRIKQFDTNFVYSPAPGTNLTKLPTMVSGVQGSVPSTFATVGVGNFVPPTAGIIKVAGWDTSGTGFLIIAPNNTYAYQVGATISGNPSPYQFNGSGTSCNGSVPAEFLLESTNIFVISGASSAVVNCIGWTENF